MVLSIRFGVTLMVFPLNIDILSCVYPRHCGESFTTPFPAERSTRLQPVEGVASKLPT
jgi:hypothetical protein